MISYHFRLKINDSEIKKTKELSWSSPPGGVRLYTKYNPKPYNHPRPITRLIWSVKNWRQTESQSVRLVNWIKHLIVAFVLYLHARVELNNNANRREKNPSPDPDSDGPLIKSEPQHMCTKKKKIINNIFSWRFIRTEVQNRSKLHSSSIVAYSLCCCSRRGGGGGRENEYSNSSIPVCLFINGFSLPRLLTYSLLSLRLPLVSLLSPLSHSLSLPA